MSKTESVSVPIQDLIELAVEFWRLEKSFQSNEETQLSMRHFSRRFQSFLEKYELRLIDMTGKFYEQGFAVEVIDVIESEFTENGVEVIDEMVSPVVLYRNDIVRHGKVVLRKVL